MSYLSFFSFKNFCERIISFVNIFLDFDLKACDIIFPHATFVVENAAQRDRFPPTAKVHIELSAKCIKGTPTLAKMLAIVAQILKSVRTPP